MVVATLTASTPRCAHVQRSAASEKPPCTARCRSIRLTRRVTGCLPRPVPRPVADAEAPIASHTSTDLIAPQRGQHVLLDTTSECDPTGSAISADLLGTISLSF
jgi:hypothetical protein